MDDAPAWTYQHASELRNHWWWRPGWSVGRRFYTWHYTFEGQSHLHQLVARYQKALDGFRNLDPIPRAWIHLTVQGLGFADDVDPDDLRHIRAAVDGRLEKLAPGRVTFSTAVVRPEALALPPMPIEPVVEAKLAIRAGIADVWGEKRVPESADTFQPHVSLAYSNDTADSNAVVKQIARVVSEPVQVVLTRPRLIQLHRDNRMYQW